MTGSLLSSLDPRRLLAVPLVYSLHSRIFGPADKKKRFVEDILKVRDGDRVLDIGCGPADFLPWFPQGEYVGFDADASYIAQARTRFGTRGEFHTAYVSRAVVDGLAPFDLAIANGVLHHLNDETAIELFATAFEALKPGGELVTCDGAFERGQNPLARLLISMDRGEHVRRADGYEALARNVFQDVTMSVHHDLSSLPYTHCVLRCRKPETAA